eukprot:1918703-Rhodomonas_salina.2
MFKISWTLVVPGRYRSTVFGSQAPCELAVSGGMRIPERNQCLVESLRSSPMGQRMRNGGVRCLFACLFAVLLREGFAQDDTMGCGGFVRVGGGMEGTKKADLSPVRAKLYTKSGVLKGETECAPNGYYYLPLYDKGEYLIKLEAPPGWLLEPEQQSVSTDPAGPCAQGIDLNFNIVGFALAGRVCTEGSSVGPAGVE